MGHNSFVLVVLNGREGAVYAVLHLSLCQYVLQVTHTVGWRQPRTQAFHFRFYLTTTWADKFWSEFEDGVRQVGRV